MHKVFIGFNKGSSFKMCSIKQFAQILLLTAVSVSANATVRVLDFDIDAKGNWIGNGQIIDDEYADWGVMISSCNTNGTEANGTDRSTGVCNDDPNAQNTDYSNRQVAFNTQKTGTQDEDLQFIKDNNYYYGFTSNQKYERLVDYKSYYKTQKDEINKGGGLWKRPGNALILNEHDSCNATACNDPDDEGTRPGGFFVFDFTDGPVDILNIDFFDIEGVEQNGTNEAKNLMYFFYADGSTTGEFAVDAPGDNKYFRRDFVDTTPESLYTNVTRLVINLPGSGAINNLIIRSTEVSAPASFGILMLSCWGVIARRKRK